MSLEDTNVIDFMGINPGDGTVVLTLTDAWDWSYPEEHLQLLQDKLNSYIRFIESGELLDKYPEAAGRVAVVSIEFRCSPIESAVDFLATARGTMDEAGIPMHYTVAESGQQPP